jgi:phosphoglycolate phosphatase-like HAD superfamily hydrolase
MKRPKIALFDLDGTQADYDGQLLKDLQRIASTNDLTEPVYDIAELTSRMTKENRPDPEDVDFGEPVGKEKL